MAYVKGGRSVGDEMMDVVEEIFQSSRDCLPLELDVGRILDLCQDKQNEPLVNVLGYMIIL